MITETEECTKNDENKMSLTIYSEDLRLFMVKLFDDALGYPQCEGDTDLGREILTMRNDIVLKRWDK